MSVLSGIRVIELANERTSWAGKLMGDMGADVILVEPEEGEASRNYPPFLDDQPGENRSLYFWHYNTSKRSVVLDLEQNTEQFLELVNSADILIESEPINRLSNLNIDYPQLSQSNKNLIHIAVTPYGRNSSLSDLPSTDLTIMAAGGPPWSCGYDNHDLPPVRGWGNQSVHTACHFATMSALTALLFRGKTGQGQFIDVSMTAALNVTTEAASYSWLVNRSIVQRQTGRHAAVNPTGETQIQCADGKWANTGVPPRFPREFQKLLDWIRALALEESFPEAVFLEMGANWDGPFDLSQIGSDDTITAIFSAGREGLKLIASSVSAYEFFTGCQNAGLAVGIINSPEEAFEDPHFKARGFQVEVEHEDFERTITYPGAPFNLPKAPWSISRRAPHKGEHTQEIFAELAE
jgi:crotonobetainyl-CoA:carnitine CoA-transferase CaiB-like acyl-CoA transferase